MTDGTPAGTPVGKEILIHAAQQDHCVIEFTRSDDGELYVKDITEHVKQLERQAGVRDA